MSDVSLVLVDFKGKKIHGKVNDLMNGLFKQSPNLEFDYIVSGYSDGSVRNYADNTIHYDRLAVYDAEDLKTMIGIIGIDSGQYFVVSPNIKNGRSWWGVMSGSVKKSKHIKNIIKVATDAIRPLDFDQAMQESYNRYQGNIHSIAWQKQSVIDKATGNAYSILKDDMLELFKRGYEPKSHAFKDIMLYINNNLEHIEKYKAYDPKVVGVWLKANGVEYKYKDDNTVHRLNDKTELPQDILGKMCLMDICNIGAFDEGLGYKHTDNHYWVICD
jgi:hypothetical protein